MRYIISNQEELVLTNLIIVFLDFAAISVLFCVTIPVLLSFLAGKYVLMCAPPSFLFVIFTMPFLLLSKTWSQEDPFKAFSDILLYGDNNQ